MPPLFGVLIFIHGLCTLIAPAIELPSTMSRRLVLPILRLSNSRVTGLHALPDLPSSALVRRISPRVASRHASTEIPPKAIVLEKPDKFRPPSHPQRLNRRPPRQYPGPPLSEPEREAQKTKRYPHMFPNEGTTLHWFLTNKWIHLWISLVCALPPLGCYTSTSSEVDRLMNCSLQSFLQD